MVERQHYGGLNEYLDSVSRFPLLSKDQEIVLGRQVQAWLNAAPDHPDYTRLARLGKRAKDKMVQSNLRLVVTVAKRYATRCKHLDMLDIVQEGNLGLVRGVEKFDPTRGFKLSTYVYWWIRQAITRAISQTDRAIRMPINVYTELGKAASQIATRSIADIAADLGKSEKYVRELLFYGMPVVSLDAPTKYEQNEGRLVDVVADTRHEDQHTELSSAAAAELRDAINSLEEQHKEVIELYFGVKPDQHAESLETIGRRYGVSRERIRQMRERAIQQLRKQLAAA